MLLSILVSAALAASAQAPAGGGEAQAPAAAAQAAIAAAAKPAPAADNASPSKQIVCRVFVETGSRLGGSHACKTRAEWDELSHDTGKTLTQVQKQAYIGNPGS